MYNNETYLDNYFSDSEKLGDEKFDNVMIYLYGD